MFFSLPKRILLLCSLINLSACHSIEKQPVSTVEPAIIQSANIIDTQTGQSITADTLLTRLANQSRVIIGEKHDNTYHHDIEYWLITELPKKR
ncbi:ChaN family lipoprotein, partial [Pseudomonas aeruginosa]|uniref:ChaN family lipoprotein n=1 Tax=Pseudomonas aeruginosa TaxID=287 RepID=UPI001F2EFEC9|nr:ChaN family lipoprotein [Pseudomonas aeruginosa]